MNKKLIAILTLVMFAMTLLPMGAFAASKNTSSGFLPVITKAEDNKPLADIRISQDSVPSNFANPGGVFTIDLPTGVEFNATVGTGDIVKAPNIANYGIVATRSSARTMTIFVATTATAAAPDLIIPVTADIKSMGTGDIVATITDVSSGVTGGNVVIGRFATGSASVRALSAPTKGESAPTFGTIRITENAGGAIDDGAKVTFRLPSNMTWNTTAANATVIAGDGGLTYVTGDGTRVLEFTASGSSATSIFEIPTPVVIDSSASYGDVLVTISGDANLDQSSLKIGAYADFGVTVTADTAKELVAGRSTQKTAKVTLKEGIYGSVLANRDIVLELPSGVKYSTPTSINLVRTSGDILPITTSINTDRNKLTIRPTAPSTTSAVTYEIRDIEVDVAPNFTGDVTAKLTGAGGVSGEVLLAKVAKPITAEATSVSIKIGAQNQSLGEILIKEAQKEALKDGNLVLRLPDNAEWSKVPTVEVVEGDLDLGTITRSGRNLVIPVDAESFVPSTIKITNAGITTNRSIAEGDVSVSIVGDDTTPANSSTALVDVAALMTNRNTILSFKVATVTTPAEDGVVQPVVMTVGSTVYTIDGVEMTMDVAPYIKDARTYFPVRYVAQALGITADNVVWDNAQRTVTIFRGNRIVQVTIGSRTMLVNGVPLTMDVAPEITADRTMLPIRFVAQGLGVNVDWDDATRTITLN